MHGDVGGGEGSTTGDGSGLRSMHGSRNPFYRNLVDIDAPLLPQASGVLALLNSLPFHPILAHAMPKTSFTPTSNVLYSSVLLVCTYQSGTAFAREPAESRDVLALP